MGTLVHRQPFGTPHHKPESTSWPSTVWEVVRLWVNGRRAPKLKKTAVY